MPSNLKWDRHWLNLAKTTAELSKDPSTKIGAVIVTPDNRQCSIGYNGFARGVEETPEKWERPTKYEYVIHAEMNAIMNCPFDVKGASVYITMSPCHRCVSHLLNAGIRKVVFPELYPRTCHQDIWFEHANLFEEFYLLTEDNRKVELDSMTF